MKKKVNSGFWVIDGRVGWQKFVFYFICRVIIFGRD